MLFFFLITFYTCLFFLVIPGVGAFNVRQRWRNFRLSLINSLQFPLFSPERSIINPQERQLFRYFGTLEALQDNDLLWLQQNRTSVSVNLRNESVFILPANAPFDLESPYSGTVQKVRWDKTGILAEGIGVFVFGNISLESGIPRFSRQPGQEFMVVFYDGLPETVLTRAIWHGRQQNEYWNDFTPFSLLTGFVALLSLAFLGFQEEANRYAGVISAAFSLMPFLPLMPPGILFFFGYRYLWRRGRSLRARKDLVALGNQLVGSPILQTECGYHGQSVSFKAALAIMVEKAEFNLVIPFRAQTRRDDDQAVQFQSDWPRDPMATPILVQGEPNSRVALTMRLVWLYEFLALGTLGLGLLVNLYLTLALIIKVINKAWIHIG